jgi:Subtilase family
MRWTFRLRQKVVTLTILEGVVAIRPSGDLRQQTSRSQIVRRFGEPTKDDAHGGKFGLALPARNRHFFERAGWVFAQPEAEVARAATARSSVEGTDAVRPVLMDRVGNLLIATNRATIQLPDDLREGEVNGLLGQDGLRVVRQFSFAPNTFEVRLPAQPLPELMHRLQEQGRSYKFAEPAFLEVLTGRLKPTKLDYSQQWQHANDGSNGGVAGADIRSERAWDKTTGRGPHRPVRIAVLDTGMQVNHPALKPGIIGGGYFEDDGMGSATFVRHQPGASGFPGGNHGTFCLGMAGARLNKGHGGCGAAPNADLIPVACLSDQVGTQTTLARALAYAAAHGCEDGQASAEDGADVISCSLGPNGADWDLTSVLDLAIQFATNQGRGGRGVSVFWAVSNGSFDVARDEICSHPEVIAVGRSNRNDQEDGSAYGPKLEFLAPGVEVFSTKSGSKCGFDTGTSFATPLAAGVAALVLARYPDWTRQEVLQRLRDSCDKVGGVAYNPDGKHQHYGHGRINAERAVQ